jgi:hypothetical protein
MYWAYKIILFKFNIFLSCLLMPPPPTLAVNSYAIQLRWQIHYASFLQTPLYRRSSFRLCGFVFVRKFISLTAGAIMIVVGRHGNWNRLLSAAAIVGGRGGGKWRVLCVLFIFQELVWKIYNMQLLFWEHEFREIQSATKQARVVNGKPVQR